jgi:hypothetical protein
VLQMFKKCSRSMLRVEIDPGPRSPVHVRCFIVTVDNLERTTAISMHVSKSIWDASIGECTNEGNSIGSLMKKMGTLLPTMSRFPSLVHFG